MGGGLGGGSTDAAAVLLGLPALLGKRIPLTTLAEIGARLGSDVPFFLYGGTALGLGRGTELHPLADIPAQPVLVVAPDVHVATPEAYRALARPALTEPSPSFKLNDFQAFTWELSEASRAGDRAWRLLENDFEAVVAGLYPPVASTIRKLKQQPGAMRVLLTGSGAAVFGLFRSREERDLARASFRHDERVYSAALVGRRRYRALWWRALREHISEKSWPPPSRHSGPSEKCTTNAS
jgi:4-diphosphocytidyl-2-C-methyl-D-erythritol kinase